MRTFDCFYELKLGILLLRHSDNLNERSMLSRSSKNSKAYRCCTCEDEDGRKLPSIKATKLDADAPKVSRKRRAPTRTEELFGGKAAPEYSDDVISHYRRKYFESLDCIIYAIENQFDQEDFRT